MWSSEILLKMMLSCLLWCVALLNCFWVFKIKGNFFFVYRIFCLNCSWLFHWSLFVLNTLWERQSPRLLHSLLGHTRAIWNSVSKTTRWLVLSVYIVNANQIGLMFSQKKINAVFIMVLTLKPGCGILEKAIRKVGLYFSNTSFMLRLWRNDGCFRFFLVYWKTRNDILSQWICVFSDSRKLP